MPETFLPPIGTVLEVFKRYHFQFFCCGFLNDVHSAKIVFLGVFSTWKTEKSHMRTNRRRLGLRYHKNVVFFIKSYVTKSGIYLSRRIVVMKHPTSNNTLFTRRIIFPPFWLLRWGAGVPLLDFGLGVWSPDLTPRFCHLRYDFLQWRLKLRMIQLKDFKHWYDEWEKHLQYIEGDIFLKRARGFQIRILAV